MSYTPADVAAHATEDDLWVYVIHDGAHVLDLTAFAARHPGGVDPLLAVAGGDATDRIRDAHPYILDRLAEFRIGALNRTM